MPEQPFSAEELALLDAIHNDPRNDKPRIDYADWLETHGQPQLAEFIRLQCQEPYFALVKQGNEEPRVSHDTFEIKSDDPTRANRAIELLRGLHQSDRFPDVSLWQEYVRGLPLYESDVGDWMLEFSVSEFGQAESPLARYRLLVRTGRLADWLAHPIMRFVDVLRIFPDEPESDFEAEFTEADIRLLERFPFLGRLEELGLCGPASEEAARLARERLEPLVPVSYDY
jgi:uncharacterized protein (TIGR02996 family)